MQSVFLPFFEFILPFWNWKGMTKLDQLYTSYLESLYQCHMKLLLSTHFYYPLAWLLMLYGRFHPREGFISLQTFYIISYYYSWNEFPAKLIVLIFLFFILWAKLIIFVLISAVVIWHLWMLFQCILLMRCTK